MGFRINTNVDALNAYYALSKVNKETATAQLRIASGKKINSVADDTTGFKIGKSLEAKTAVQKSQLNNASAAKNYLATAESSLMQINDLLIQISGKSADANDPTKDKTAIANDIRAAAGEIDTLLKNTGFNGRNILAQTDGTALASSDTFGIGGSDFTADFASDSYLKADDLKKALHGTSTVVTSPASRFLGSAEYLWRIPGSTGEDLTEEFVAYTGPDTTSTFQITLEDGTTVTGSANVLSGSTYETLWSEFNMAINGRSAASKLCSFTDEDETTPELIKIGVLSVIPFSGRTENFDNKITSIKNISGYDLISKFGLNMNDGSGIGTGGLMSDDTDTVLTSAKNISTVTDNVRASLGRIGNLTQTVDMRTEYLNNSISNNMANISSLFDADVAEEQMKSTRGSILGQAATSMLTQLNSAPQAVLSLFK